MRAVAENVMLPDGQGSVKAFAVAGAESVEARSCDP